MVQKIAANYTQTVSEGVVVVDLNLVCYSLLRARRIYGLASGQTR